MEKRIFKIKAGNFLNWYFCSGSDQEQEDAANSIGNRAIESLINSGQFNITVDELFNECNKDAILLSFIEGFDNEENDCIELGDFTEGYELILIP